MSDDITTPPADDLDLQNVVQLEPAPQPQEPEGVTGGGVPAPSTPPPAEPSSVPPAPQAPSVDQPVFVDAKALAQQLTEAQRAQQPQPQMTQQQIDQILRTVSLQDKDVEDFFNADTPLENKKQILTNMLLQAVENAVARNNVIMQDTMTRFYRDEFLPISAKITRDEANSAKNAFYQEYPGLEDYSDAVSLVAKAALQDPSYKGLSSKQVSQKVADSVTALLRKTLPDFDPKVKVNGQTQPKGSVPKATIPSFPVGTKVTSTPASGQYPSSGPADSDVFGDEGLY